MLRVTRCARLAGYGSDSSSVLVVFIISSQPAGSCVKKSQGHTSPQLSSTSVRCGNAASCASQGIAPRELAGKISEIWATFSSDAFNTLALRNLLTSGAVQAPRKSTRSSSTQGRVEQSAGGHCSPDKRMDRRLTVGSSQAQLLQDRDPGDSGCQDTWGVQANCCTMGHQAIAVQHVTHVAVQYAACWVLRFLGKVLQP